ncbi:hypothetical protein EMIT019CA3_30021 [Bacillus pseudomycoides]
MNYSPPILRLEVASSQSRDENNHSSFLALLPLFPILDIGRMKFLSIP